MVIKKNLSYRPEENYSKIWNACIDYDNEYSDLNLLDYIQDENFMNDELVEMYIRENPDETRLRFFFGDTYVDSLYKLDGYGNLINVEKGDFEILIDELVDIINDSLEHEGELV